MDKFTIFFGISVLILISSFWNQKNTNIQEYFQIWKAQHGIIYNPIQNLYRLNIFKNNMDLINNHNSRLMISYKYGLNQFSSITTQEFKQKYLYQINQEISPNVQQISSPQLKSSTDIDWISFGAIGPVKNQGNCGAPYAFSVAEAISGGRYIVLKVNQELSVQQIIDCSLSYGNNGCLNGGTAESYQYVVDKGIQPATRYPYVGNLQPCKVSTGQYQIIGYLNVTNGCNGLANSLTIQPVSVSVDGENFQFYKSGIFSNCGTKLSVVALLVGMTDQYWKLKLSWGTTWGQQGYIRLARGNTCGVCNLANYPII